jgi:hypothetical protein
MQSWLTLAWKKRKENVDTAKRHEIFVPIGSENVFFHVVEAKWLNVDVVDDEMGEDVFPMDKEPNQIYNDNMNTTCI